MTRHYHTIIVGAGPGGLSAARWLTGDCLVLDKKEAIGLSVRCGEGISLQALAREGIQPSDEWIVRRIHRIRRIMPNGKGIGERHDQAYACVLHRPRFESFLSSGISHEIRLNEGVDAIERVDGAWRVRTNRGNEYRSIYLIGADGPASRMAKMVFGRRHRIAAGWNHHMRFNRRFPDSDTLDMYFGSGIAPGGYGWFFPTSEQSANVGLLIKKRGSSGKEFRKFIDAIIRPAYGDFVVEADKSGALPVSGRVQSVMRDNAFLVGDAGGFTDPIFCGGIGMALLTGRMAAESINRNRPEHYNEAIGLLPFTNEELLSARDSFYSLDDETLNQLGELLHGQGMDYLASREGRKAFMGFDRLVENREAIVRFAKVWGAAKAFLW